MGLDINVRKPIRFLGTKEPSDFEDWTYVYTLPDFAPIKHLTMFQEGYWEAEYYREPHFDMSCGGFNRNFRNSICLAMYGMDYDTTINAMSDGKISFDVPFAEMLWFADNEGCFDYVIAEKLLKDFRDNADKILPTMIGYLQNKYAEYMSVLEKCVEIRGIVDYH
jgi:hypothetical protein